MKTSMEGPLGPEGDVLRMRPRRSEAIAKGGHAYQGLLQLAETFDFGQVRGIALVVGC